jgi:2-hydroxycyclohexanecarboxyl-CoA dehydrogenase
VSERPLAGPVALVTGAARGLGHATALRLAADGYTVAVNDITDDGRLSDLAKRIGGVPVPADISDPAAAPAMIAAIRERAGPVQVLVANAAAMTMSPFLDAAPGDWWRHIDVNLSGHFRLIQAVIPAMRAAGHGRIVIIASGWGVIGHPNATGYAAAKAGLIALTKSLAVEWGASGVRVNALCPGWTATELNRGLWEDPAAGPATIATVPMQRWGRAEEMAGPTLFLASGASSFMTGQTLIIDGGQSIAP